MMSRLGDAPIEPQYRDQMQSIATALDQIFNGDPRDGNRKIGFVLLVFEFGDNEGRCNYISNGDRKDVVTMMKEQIKRFEGQPEMKGRA